MEFLTARPCTGHSFAVYPAAMYDLPLSECGLVLKRRGWKVRDLGFMIDVITPECTFTLYRTGRVLINPCGNEATALEKAEMLFSEMQKDKSIARVLREEGAVF